MKLCRGNETIPKNSIVDASTALKSPYGLRCFSSSLEGVHEAEWISSSGNKLSRNSSPIAVHTDKNCGYTDLYRTMGVADQYHPEGIFTCRISDEHNVTKILHIGVYLSNSERKG